MKRTLFALAITVSAAMPAFAADELALAQSKNCMSCHAVYKKVVGRASRAAPAHYAGQ